MFYKRTFGNSVHTFLQAECPSNQHHTSTIKNKNNLLHNILILKFKHFSRTFKDPQISFSRTNSRRKFTACAVEQQYLMFIYVCDSGTVIR